MYHEIHTPSAAYKFRLYPIGTIFKRIAGIYIFLIIPPQSETPNVEAETLEAVAEVAEALEAQYSLLYIGLTNDFYARLAAHHKIQAAITLGMTHIGILRKSSGRKRKKIERDLLQNLNPPLNQTWIHDIS